MDADKIKDFVVYNFEKLIVAIIMLISAFLVYSGLGKEDITKKHDPAKLVTDAKAVRAEVDEDHSDTVLEGREPEFDIAQAQSELEEPIPVAVYNHQNIWDGTLSERVEERRRDPVLLKPMAVQTVGVVAPMAFRSKDGEYALTSLEPAEALEIEEQKPKPRSRGRRNRNTDMMGMGMEDMGMGMEDMGMDMGMDMMMGGMGGPMPGNSESTGPVRKLKPADNLGINAKPQIAWQNGAEQLPIPAIGYFIAGAAVIPHKELIGTYQEALSNASEYNPTRRDMPQYIDFQVQRADVTNKTVDQLQEADWISRQDRRLTTIDAGTYWCGVADEVVPRDYRIDGTTMWIPPVMLDDPTSFSTHPLIPMRSQRELENERLEAEAKERGETFVPAPAESIELDDSGNAQRNFGGMGMGMGMEDMGMDDMGMEDMGMDMMGGMGMGMGMMGGGSGMAGKPAEENPVDYKLLRFYDFAYVLGARQDPNAPRRGRKYVYRIRFAVNDPNFPKKPEMQPLPKSLGPEAYQRVSALIADAKQNNKRDYKRWSEWSEVSLPTSLPELDRAVVGDLKDYKGKIQKVGPRRILIEPSPPTAEVVASSFNAQLGTWMSTRMDVTEGSVLSKDPETADVVDPVTLEIKKLENPNIRSTTTVIDIQGGVPLEIVEDETQTQPSMFLMIDSAGNLKVQDSVGDQRLYRIRSFAEERGL